MEPQRRREQLMEAAVKLFGKQGYHVTTISHIIAQAEVARGTFYLYFVSKREIFESILEDAFRQIISRIQRVSLDPGAGSPREQLEQNVERILTYLSDRPDLAKVLLNQAVGLDEELDEKLGSFYRQISDLIAGSLTLGMSMGLLRPCEPRILAPVILGGFKELTYLLVVEQAPLSRASAVKEILAYSLNGLMAR